MSTMTIRRSSALVGVLAALLATGLLPSSQAEARTIYACVRGDGSAHLFVHKPKCKGGESRISWG